MILGRLLSVRSKDAWTPGCHLALGAWPGLCDIGFNVQLWGNTVSVQIWTSSNCIHTCNYTSLLNIYLSTLQFIHASLSLYIENLNDNLWYDLYHPLYMNDLSP